MLAGPLILLLPIAIAIFGIAGKHALDTKKEKKYREMWGSVFWAVLPLAAPTVVWIAGGESSMIARTAILGLIGAIAGFAGLVWVGHVVHDRSTKSPAAPAGTLTGAQPQGQPMAITPKPPNIQNTVTSYNQSGGITANTVSINAEDRSVKRRTRQLFDSIDQRINWQIDKGASDIVVRMEPHHIERLQALIAEAGNDRAVQIRGFGRRYIESLLMNGTLGPTGAVPDQTEVELAISPTLRGH